jgi:hypothetical protein
MIKDETVKDRTRSFITRTELAKELNTSVATVVRGIKNDTWPYNSFVRIGSQIRYPVALLSEIRNKAIKEQQDISEETNAEETKAPDELDSKKKVMVKKDIIEKRRAETEDDIGFLTGKARVHYKIIAPHICNIRNRQNKFIWTSRKGVINFSQAESQGGKYDEVQHGRKSGMA